LARSFRPRSAPARRYFVSGGIVVSVSAGVEPMPGALICAPAGASHSTY
jgi:hypothetical protein